MGERQKNEIEQSVTQTLNYKIQKKTKRNWIFLDCIIIIIWK